MDAARFVIGTTLAAVAVWFLAYVGALSTGLPISADLVAALATGGVIVRAIVTAND